MPKPTLLFATQHLPCSAQVYGAQLRAYHTAKALQEFADVQLWVFPFTDVPAEDLAKTEAEFGPTRIVKCTQNTPKSPTKILAEQFQPSCGKVGRVFPSPAEQISFLEEADNCAVVWFHCLVIPNLFNRTFWPHSVIDIDDVPSQVWQGRLTKAVGFIKKIRARRQVSLWKKREHALIKRFSAITVCSEDDLRYLRLPCNIPRIVPNGFSPPVRKVPRSSSKHLRIGFIGTFQYFPNIEGVEWFLSEIWPLILKKLPKARLRMVGNGSEKFTNKELNLDGLGFVDDADAEMATWACSIVPLLSGGGTRIKIAEAFCKQCPIVSTSLGAHGYSLTDGEHCRIADTAHDFAEASLELLLDPKKGELLAERALQEFERNWDWRAITPNIIAAAQSAIEPDQLKHYA